MIENAYGARREAEVMEATWGHLRPGPGRHDGTLIAARSEYNGGERVLIAADFRDVPDSPTLYEAMLDFVDETNMDEGGVYRFTGALVVADRRARFEGEWVRVATQAG